MHYSRGLMHDLASSMCVGNFSSSLSLQHTYGPSVAVDTLAAEWITP